jgi:hypothetical protein
MKNCDKFLKKMYFGGFVLLCMYLNPLWSYSTVVAVIVTILLWIVSLIYILPYFRCYGENLRRKR